ncbi:DUF262 domain-containing protein [Paenibacillus sp. TRM 82003]|uniref:GmrSD restriction endonuclease domain-containing protein n=1 Tax=Kineococcus sp. TRM81007 TaxID=2925831 RepID=UPI001F5A0074|nr:DUF262 domain-containing protein [Kineococcus sp. TRM81007]MCI2239529.1 DUF262 domain-containing protein [Kineococcus sp. TRM81007]MCI3926189.1 DUF262 domain-containing protein [Paenibacillus sp. TRM 82003]
MQISPETYPIADFLKWHRDRELVLDPDFQRGSVWKESAKSFLIDSILRGMPVPKILFRTRIDRNTMQIVREVVDGQQRLRAIIAFANGELRLGSRSQELAGLTYRDLEDGDQDKFLAYKLTTEQLINANNEDVLEIFSRINSYTVPVNGPELRHARYDSDFKWSVVESVRKLVNFWRLGILSDRERVRMADAAFVAEMYGFVLNGVTDGGSTRIDKLYKDMEDAFPRKDEVESIVQGTCEFLASELLPEVAGGPMLGAPNVLMLFAAVAHVRHGLPLGRLEAKELTYPEGALSDIKAVVDNLKTLSAVLEDDEPEGGWGTFWSASKSTTQRIASRRVRLSVFLRALGPQAVTP